MRISKPTLLLLLLILANLIPIWCFRYFPSQDGATHLHTAQAIMHAGDPRYPAFAAWYHTNLSPFPNWTAHLLLMLFMTAVPALIAEKLLLTLYAVLFPLSVICLIRSVSQRPAPALIPQLLPILFVHNYLLYMGFYGFLLGLPPCFFALAYWWRHRERLGLPQALAINGFLFATYFSHLVCYGLLVGLLVMLAVLEFAVSAAEEYRAGRRAAFPIRRAIPLAVIVVSLLPSLALTCVYLSKSGVAVDPVYPTLRGLLRALFPMGTLYYMSGSQKIVGYAVSILMLFLVGFTLYRDKLRIEGATVEFAASRRDYFLLASLAVLALYAVAPVGIGEGSYLSDRLIFLPPLLLLPWLADDYPGKIGRITQGALVLLCLSHVALLGYGVWKFNGVMREFASGDELVGRNHAIIGLMRDREGGFAKVAPYANATSYYCIDRGNVNLVNYQAEYGCFGIRFNKGLDRPPIPTLVYEPGRLHLAGYARNAPYVVAWGLPDSGDIEHDLLTGYTLVRKTARLKIFRANLATSGPAQGPAQE